MMTTLSTKKETKMATKPIDVSAMSSAELDALIKSAQAIVNGKRKSELKAIVDTFTSSLSAAGFSKSDGIEALGGVRPTVVSRPKTGTKKSKGPQPKWGATYKNPETGETWTKSASGKGGLKKWLADAIASGKTFEELESK
jgi:DNA-binding protein H-NS